jgi:hypothetical protein
MDCHAVGDIIILDNVNQIGPDARPTNMSAVHELDFTKGDSTRGYDKGITQF